MFIAIALMIQLSANAQSNSGGFLINQSGIDRSALENLKKSDASRSNLRSKNSVVVTGSGGGYLIDQSSIGGKTADMIVGGGDESTTTTSTSTNRSASADRQRAKQINRQADATSKAYERYKSNPNAWSSGAYHSSERRLKSMQKR